MNNFLLKVFYPAAFTLIAYCDLRRDVRLFAVERVRSISLTDHPYQFPLGFDIEAYVQDALQELTLQKDGRLRLVLRVADTAELVG